VLKNYVEFARPIIERDSSLVPQVLPGFQAFGSGDQDLSPFGGQINLLVFGAS
jgi:hypothetical protein